MGYSDLTGLLNAIHFRTGMVTFHGPMGLDNWDSISVGYFQQVLQQGRQVNFSNPPSFNLSAVTTITSGTTTGRLVGGNLSVFTAMLGSKFLPPPEAFRNFILFLEEVGEETYRLDRMLEQLALSGILQAVRGFVFGVCTDCSTALSCDGPVPPASQTFSVAQVLQQKVQPLGVPAFAGAMFGHELPQQFILPIGGLVSIDADAGTITMLESAVALPRAPRV
jgi:muramoyltetrapeptide carboxypeptidase